MRDKRLSNRADAGRPRILYVGTSPLSAQWFLRGQLRYMREAGLDITLTTSPGRGLDQVARREGVRAIGLPMRREISPARDLVSLWRAWRLIRSVRPDIVNVGTPKAGLLIGLAAWLCRVPCRIYTLHGLRLETTRGPVRAILWLSEWLACHFAQRVICVSESVKRAALALGIVGADRAVVLGSGSCNGVDAKRFEPTDEATRGGLDTRLRLGIPDHAPVVGFVGRLTRDKGIPELLDAYRRIRRDNPELRLLLVGDPENGDPLPRQCLDAISKDPHIICTGLVDETADYYHAMNVLALPTYREGFGLAALEAHAAAKPVIATQATGVVDAVRDGVDGILVPIGDSGALAEAIARLLKDPELAAEMGRAGRERVLREFRQEQIWAELANEYARLLDQRGLRAPHPPAPAPDRTPTHPIAAGIPANTD